MTQEDIDKGDKLIKRKKECNEIYLSDIRELDKEIAKILARCNHTKPNGETAFVQTSLFVKNCEYCGDWKR